MKVPSQMTKLEQLEVAIKELSDQLLEERTITKQEMRKQYQYFIRKLEDLRSEVKHNKDNYEFFYPRPDISDDHET